MLKKTSILLTGFCLFFFTCFNLTAKTYTFSYATQNSDRGWGPVHADIPWIKSIEDASNGRIKIKPYFSQTLAKGKDIWPAVQDGVADMGWSFHAYWPGMTSLADVISLPSLPFKSAEEASGALWKLYEKFPQIRKQFSDNHVILLYTSDPYILMTTKKHVKKLEDMNGLRIRMMGGPSTEMMKALGGVPMSIPMPDNYISMQKGVTDGMGSSWEAAIAFRLYEVAPYYTIDVSFPVVYFSISMNKDVWEDLPKDIQEIFNKAGGLEGSMFFGKYYMDSAKDELFEKARSEGYPTYVYSLPDDERARWLEVGGKPIWNDWLDRMNKEGHPEAQEILNTLLKMH